MYKKEAIQIENVQRRATKLVKNIQHLSYSDRSRYLGLPSLQYRRLALLTIQTRYIAIKSLRKMRTPPEATSIKSTRSIVELILENTVYRKEQQTLGIVCPRKSNIVNWLKNQLNSNWKDLEIKFRPYIYKPEVTNGYDQSRRVAGANQPKCMTSTPGKCLLQLSRYPIPTGSLVGYDY